MKIGRAVGIARHSGCRIQPSHSAGAIVESANERTASVANLAAVIAGFNFYFAGILARDMRDVHVVFVTNVFHQIGVGELRGVARMVNGFV